MRLTGKQRACDAADVEALWPSFPQFGGFSMDEIQSAMLPREAPPELAFALATAATSASRLLAPPEHELDRLWHTVDAARLTN